MAFTAPPDIDERGEWLNARYNALVDAVDAGLTGIDGTDMAAPVTLDQNLQDLCGGRNTLYNFARLFGTSGGALHRVAVRDVCGFGAIGDGATSCATYFAAAIADLPEEGGIILVPPGVYLLDSAITLRGAGSTGHARVNVLLLGFGSSSILRLSASGDGHNAVTMGDANQITYHAVCGVSFDGVVGSRVAGHTFKDTFLSVDNIPDGSFAMVSDCRFYDIYGDCVNASFASASKVSSLVVEDCFASNFHYGVYVGSLTGCSIDSCSFSDTDIAGGVELSYSCFDTHVHGCVFSDCFKAFRVSIGSGYTVEANSIEHCAMARCGHENQNGGAVEFYNSSTGSGIRIKNTEVHGNCIADSLGSGIRAYDLYAYDPYYSYISDVGVSGNVIAGATWYCVDLIRPTGFGAGLGSGHGWAVVGNAMSNPDTACVAIEGGDGAYSFLLWTHFSVVGNAITDDRADSATMAYGVSLGQSCQSMSVVGNAIFGATTAPVLDYSRMNDVAHNTGVSE